jgi:hypothetical protein
VNFQVLALDRRVADLRPNRLARLAVALPAAPYADRVTSEVAAAVIAAVVSVVVAAASVGVTFITTRASLRRDRDRQEADFRRKMTEKLYDRRVVAYQGLFGITESFRSSKLNGTKDLSSHFTQALERLDEWLTSEGGLILSDSAYKELLSLRGCVRRYLAEGPDSDRRPRLKDNIWARKNSLRSALRADLGLLFDEDNERPLSE